MARGWVGDGRDHRGICPWSLAQGALSLSQLYPGEGAVPCPTHMELSVSTESLAGFLLSVNATATLSRLRIPYPQTGSWYLSLRSLCATEHG